MSFPAHRLLFTLVSRQTPGKNVGTNVACCRKEDGEYVQRGADACLCGLSCRKAWEGFLSTRLLPPIDELREASLTQTSTEYQSADIRSGCVTEAFAGRFGSPSKVQDGPMR